MRYIIMCGGNYRAWAQPRQLLKFNGEIIVCRTIRLLQECGVTDIAISTNKPGFDSFGVPVLSHNNSYDAIAYNESFGDWFNCFYPTTDPVCYLFGDVIYSYDAIHKIVNTDTNDIMLFGSAPPFAPEYCKRWIEPFAFKVVNTEHMRHALYDVRRLDREGKFTRRPIAWEVWNVISRGPDGDVTTIDYNSYVHINDWTCDIDKPDELPIIEQITARIKR